MPGVSLGLAGPDCKNFPPHSCESGLIGAVTGYVGVKLGVPKFAASLRSLLALAAAMAMPETAVDKDNRAVTRKHDIRGAGKVSPV